MSDKAAAARGLFHHPGLRRTLVRLRKPIAVACLLALLPFARREWLLAGFSVSMLGEALQVWCFAALDKNATLTVRGPYTLVRNPMYLGRFFILLGFVMLAGNAWLVLGYTLAYWFYMDARVQREEARLQPIFGPAYDAYRSVVRRFVPGWPAAGHTVAFWSWGLFRQNHAGSNLLATLAAWAVIAAWTLR